LEEKKFQKFKKSVFQYLCQNKIKPDIILTDLHPLFKTTVWGKELAKKVKAKHIQIQHHLAHIFSAVGEKLIQNSAPAHFQWPGQNSFIGIACDGTGYGLDGKIWGGEVFKFKSQKSKVKIYRIGHLENQILIGGELAIREPARMLISILNKIPNSKFQIPNSKGKVLVSYGAGKFKIQNSKLKKNFIYSFIKKYYTKNQFELLYNQLQENFNCIETSSTGRILDAVSLLLGFCKNERNYKHEPIDLLEKNSTIPYKINSNVKTQNSKFILMTTPLFEYLIKNLHRDKKKLAATAQFYIAQGLYQIISKSQIPNSKQIQPQPISNGLGCPAPACVSRPWLWQNSYFAGGLAKNKIISNYLESKGVYINKKIPCGDAGISFGQIAYYILNNLDKIE